MLADALSRAPLREGGTPQQQEEVRWLLYKAPNIGEGGSFGARQRNDVNLDQVI